VQPNSFKESHSATYAYPLRYRYRYRCAWDAKLTSEVVRAFVPSVFVDPRRLARIHHGVRQAQSGSVKEIRRFGSALSSVLHFHSIVLDGV
jgi:hypothetical protein